MCCLPLYTYIYLCVFLYILILYISFVYFVYCFVSNKKYSFVHILYVIDFFSLVLSPLCSLCPCQSRNLDARVWPKWSQIGQNLNPSIRRKRFDTEKNDLKTTFSVSCFFFVSAWFFFLNVARCCCIWCFTVLRNISSKTANLYFVRTDCSFSILFRSTYLCMGFIYLLPNENSMFFSMLTNYFRSSWLDNNNNNNSNIVLQDDKRGATTSTLTTHETSRKRKCRNHLNPSKQDLIVITFFPASNFKQSI